MSLSVRTRNDLKVLPATARIRFVEDDIAFFWQDLTTDMEPDGVNTVLSNINTRWRKTFSAASSGEFIVWESTPGSFLATTGRGYIKAPTNGDETVILPENPTLGAPVGIVKANGTNYGTNRVLINRNGSLINGEPFSRQLVFQGQRVILQFLGGSVGWKIESDQPVFYHSGSVLSFAAPVSLDSPQRGIFDLVGRGFNPAGVWANPVLSGELNISRYALATGSSVNFLTDQLVNTGTGVTTTTSLTSETVGNRNIGMLESGFLHIGFEGNSGRMSQVKLSGFYLNVYVAASPNNLPRWFTVYGCNNPQIKNILNYGTDQNTGDKRYNLPDLLIRLKLDKITSVDTSNLSQWLTPSNATTYRHRYVPVNSSQYYRDFVIIADRGSIADLGTMSSASINLWTELEFYGDIQTVYTP